MHIVNIDRITVNHAGREIFRELSWNIGDHDRVGLVGPNGAGKSSLLKALTREVQPDSGLVTLMRGVRIGYLPQDVHLTPGKTLLEEVLTLPPKLAEADRALAQVESDLADPHVYENPELLSRTLELHDKALSNFEALGGTRHRSRVLEILHLLGFTADDFDLMTDTLSGGEKKLVVLTRLAVEQPDVLLLDEPDNHLDIAAKDHLARFIKQFAGAVILVSHDRYLLDEVVTQIAELADGKLTVYTGNYTAYTTERQLARLRQQQLYIAQQKRIAQIEEAIKEWEIKASGDLNERHARQAKSRRKMLARMEENGELVDRVTERRLMDLQLDGWRGSTKALEIKDLAMGFNDDLLFVGLDFLLRHGERVGLVGPNGAGKSVLFKLILGEMEPLEGVIKVGPSIRLGYYSQEHQTLSGWLHRTPIELVRDLKAYSEGEAVTFLIKMLFSYDQTRQPIGTMSGGERSRLQLACLMLEQPNLLLLDEPTNNLDIPSVEVLESVLEDFEGALLLISHDRYFLDRVVDTVVELDNGQLTEYIGGYTDYMNRKKGR